MQIGRNSVGRENSATVDAYACNTRPGSLTYTIGEPVDTS